MACVPAPDSRAEPRQQPRLLASLHSVPFELPVLPLRARFRRPVDLLYLNASPGPNPSFAFALSKCSERSTVAPPRAFSYNRLNLAGTSEEISHARTL